MTRNSSRALRYFTLCLALGAILSTVSACKRATPEGMPKLVPCSVSIIQDGQPCEGAAVTLFTDDHTWAVSGTTDASGVAKIFTHGTYPGAPLGKYTVVVSKQVVEEPEATQSASEIVSGGTAYNFVDPQFGSKSTSPLELEVTGKTSASFDVGAAIHEAVKPL